MEIKYPFIIPIVGVVVLVILIWKKQRKNKKNIKKNSKVANTNLVKKTNMYKQLAKKYHIIAYTSLGLLIFGILTVTILSSRIITVQEIDDKIYNRDIILCMDISTSMNMVNRKIADTYDNIVASMKKERFGISIFNKVSLLRVPLTDDYDFVREELDIMRHIYDLIGYSEDIDWSKLSDDEESEVLAYLSPTTPSGSGVSSATGDGLASCIFDFPDLETERSRIIILSSDNEVYGDQKIDLIDSAKIAKKKNIKVYALAPKADSLNGWGSLESRKKVREDLKRAAEITGGKLYLIGDSGTVSNVINEIEKTEATLLEGNYKTIELDHPELLYILALLSIFISFVAIGVVI